MPVAIHNFSYTYQRKGKPIFVPTTVGRRIGVELKRTIENTYTFDPIYFHLRPGGHVAAMHHHRDSAFFARIDIARFFYSISRRRVQSALDRLGLDKVAFFAKWSTVLNPYGEPRHVLPYGFVQSPILASLVIATSQVGAHLLALPEGIKASVYMDDIALSAASEVALADAFQTTVAALVADGFEVSEAKMRLPAPSIDIFNCDLSSGRSTVRVERIREFLAAGPNQRSEDAFIAYCATVESGNAT